MSCNSIFTGTSFTAINAGQERPQSSGKYSRVPSPAKENTDVQNPRKRKAPSEEDVSAEEYFSAEEDTNSPGACEDVQTDGKSSPGSPSQLPVPPTVAPAPPPAKKLTKIPDDAFAAAYGQPYDRDWMARLNMSMQVLDGFSSKLKLNSLLSQGAVKAGDKFSVKCYTRTGPGEGTQVVKFGEVLEGFSVQVNFPDIRILQPRAGSQGMIRGIAGPQEFANAIGREFPEVTVQGNGWKDVRVVSREGQDIGSLYMVRQAYHVWREQQTDWATRNQRESAVRRYRTTNGRPCVDILKAKRQKV